VTDIENMQVEMGRRVTGALNQFHQTKDTIPEQAHRSAESQPLYDRMNEESRREMVRARTEELRERAAQRAQQDAREALEEYAEAVAKVGADPAVQSNILMEAAEIRERAKRIEEETPEYAKARVHVLGMLRDEYAEALEAAGLQGATTCAAILRAGKVLGISGEEIYGSLRAEQHMAALEEARRYRMAEQTIPASVPSLDRGVVRDSHWRKGGSPRVMIPRGGPISGGGGKRRPSWK
jgi:hypothetical protein